MNIDCFCIDCEALKSVSYKPRGEIKYNTAWHNNVEFLNLMIINIILIYIIIKRSFLKRIIWREIIHTPFDCIKWNGWLSKPLQKKKNTSTIWNHVNTVFVKFSYLFFSWHLIYRSETYKHQPPGMTIIYKFK